jgi:deoxyribodipyrimidine photo-lyase
VLYWMVAARRSRFNHALDRAADWARHLRVPLLVLEAVRSDYRWASERFHHFLVEGMRDNQSAFEEVGIGYYPYVEPHPREGRGLVEALSQDAALVVIDRAPVFDVPRWVASAEARLAVRVEEVDSCGVLPIDAAPSGLVFPTAYAFRRFLQRALPDHLEALPRPVCADTAELGPPPRPAADVEARWPRANFAALLGPSGLAHLPIDHTILPTEAAGGQAAALRHLSRFVSGLAAYGERRNHPDDDAVSGLSPYLHFGQLSSHEVAMRVLKEDGWSPERVSRTTTGAKEGWWGASSDVEAFLDQLVTWRELGLNMSARRPDIDQYESLPPWALATLAKHEADPRPHVYTLDEFAGAATHDPLWNAAQRQLVREGRMHNYLRMLWGKKILEWTRTPREACAVMIELNNRYALDGRDPNSYSGIFWVLGRYDRPWPERPIYGTVRYMTSESTMRKLRVKEYLRRYGSAASLF